ncbi:DNA polymerase alpha subunit B-like [Artemia franciscana]|uniref:DNA polymerase alpha subunit B n=1 Tax=Artemia franciscana TaxID=6661 RepID=A0AA88HKL5_ARTSF|nr:hypothetical protein QYM36_014981 [Artemia franciscana]
MAVSAEAIEDEFSSFGINLNENELNNCIGLCVRYTLSEEELADNWVAFSSSLPSNDQSLKESSLKKFDEYLEKQKKTTVIPINSQITNETEVPKTPANVGTKRQIDLVSPELPLKNSTPSLDVIGKYKNRTNSLNALVQYGDPRTNWIGERWEPNIQIWRKMGEYKYMYQSLRDVSYVFDDLIDYMGSIIVEENDLGEVANVSQQHPDPVICVGRICCEAADARLNSKSVLLQGSVSSSKGGTTSLDVSEVANYALFPGQVVAVRGSNPTGKIINVSEIYYPKVESPMSLKPSADKGILQMVVACGPFHIGDSLNFSPLEDFLKYVVNSKPQLCLLLGPIISARKLNANNWPSNLTFKEELDRVVNLIDLKLGESETKVYIVASSMECSETPVYPTPPFRVPSKNISVVSDPVKMRIEDLKVNLTSSDIFRHLTDQEIKYGGTYASREERILQYLLEQKSMYPLYPPSLHMNIDYVQWENYARIEETPHIIVLPSDYKGFIKAVNGILFVNPERLVKNDSGGTFARIAVDMNAEDVSSQITAEIVYI